MNTQGPSKCLNSVSLPHSPSASEKTPHSGSGVLSRLTNFAFDSNFGTCVEFFLHSRAKDPLLWYMAWSPCHLGKFAPSYI